MDRLDAFSTAPSTYRAYLAQQGQQLLDSVNAQLARTPINVQPLIDPALSQDALKGAQMQNTGAQGSQSTILGTPAPLTQPFGNSNPNVEVFSKGINSGADFGAPVGTTVALPQGQWQILQAYAGDTTPGHVGDDTNSGYGNSVLAQNLQTGEKLRFSHLSQVGVQPGQDVSGGNVIGATGQTGNVTGPHLDLEYYNSAGQLGDVLKSPYAADVNTTSRIQDTGPIQATPSSYKPAVQAASRQMGVPSNILSALLMQESGFNPQAQSPAGAIGIAQFMPDTAKTLGIDPTDPVQAISGAAEYLRGLYEQTGSWPLALAAYNAGLGAVEQYGGIPPFPETQNYVASIMAMASGQGGGNPFQALSSAIQNGLGQVGHFLDPANQQAPIIGPIRQFNAQHFGTPAYADPNATPQQRALAAMQAYGNSFMGSDTAVRDANGNLVSMPVKTGLQDLYANRDQASDAVRRYMNQLGGGVPAQGASQMDIDLYPDLVKQWQTAYGANRKPPGQIGAIAAEVNDALKAAMAKYQK